MNDKEHVSIENMELLLSAFLELIKSVGPIQYINNSIVTSAIDIIHGNYSDISSKQLAKYLNINESYFIRTFTKTMGISPMKYIRAVRVTYGKELIKSGMSISEAAELCGYSSQSAFYNATKAEFKVSPSELKKLK
jgi:AraC-like DNA-binding protein